jgi:hypothetical protein
VELDSLPLPQESLCFLILGQRVRVRFSDPEVRQFLIVNFGAMATPNDDVAPDLQYWIERSGTQPSFSLIRHERETCEGADPDDLLFLLEKDITVELQKRRPDLFFLHSAAIEWQGNACLLAAESGSGKSITAWALLHHGFRYLSDELSPIDLDSMRVFPYPHALCLKQEPPPAYALPANVIRLGRRIHIPTEALPSTAISGPRPLGAVFLVTHRPDLGAPELRAIGRSEASARLYVTALNALAHTSHGLDAVVRISEHVPCFAVSSAELSATCALIGSTVDHVIGRRVETS